MFVEDAELVDLDVHPRKIMQILRHAQIAVTMEIYARYPPKPTCGRRFSADQLQTVIDLHRSGATAEQVAQTYGFSKRNIKRLLQQHGISRERRNA